MVLRQSGRASRAVLGNAWTKVAGWSRSATGDGGTPAPPLPAGAELLRSTPGRLAAQRAFDPRTAVVVMTHNLERDLEYLRVLRAGGFFNYEPVEVNGHLVRPVDLTARLLFPQWKLQPGEGDFTIMRISMEGSLDGKHTSVDYDLLDRYDAQSDTISMARTTGYTCTAVANLLLSGKFERKGICPPEYVGEAEGALDFVMGYLAERGVQYRKTVTE